MWDSASASVRGWGVGDIFYTYNVLAHAQDFAEGFLEDKLTPFYKSEPVPESVSLNS